MVSICLALQPFVDAGTAGGVVVAILLIAEHIVLFLRQVVEELRQLVRVHLHYHFVIIFHRVLHEVFTCFNCPWNKQPLTSLV